MCSFPYIGPKCTKHFIIESSAADCFPFLLKLDWLTSNSDFLKTRYCLLFSAVSSMVIFFFFQIMTSRQQQHPPAVHACSTPCAPHRPKLHNLCCAGALSWRKPNRAAVTSCRIYFPSGFPFSPLPYLKRAEFRF